MKFLFGVCLMIGGLCGAIMGFLGNVVVNSSLAAIDGMEMSIGLALFSIVVFITGVANLFPSN